MLQNENINEFDRSDTNVMLVDENRNVVDSDMEGDQFVSSSVCTNCDSRVLKVADTPGNTISNNTLHHLEDGQSHRCPEQDRKLQGRGMFLQQLRLLEIIHLRLVRIQVCQK